MQLESFFGVWRRTKRTKRNNINNNKITTNNKRNMTFVGGE